MKWKICCSRCSANTPFPFAFCPKYDIIKTRREPIVHMVSRRGSHFVANWCIVDFVFGLVVVTVWKNQDQRYIVKICCRAPCGRVGLNDRFVLRRAAVICRALCGRVGLNDYSDPQNITPLVAPRVGAWILISPIFLRTTNQRVAPCVGAWV